MIFGLFVALLVAAAATAIIVLTIALQRLRRGREQADFELAALRERVRGIVDVDAERQRVLAQIAHERAALLAQTAQERAAILAQVQEERRAIAARATQEYSAIVGSAQVDRDQLIASVRALQGQEHQLRTEIAGLTAATERWRIEARELEEQAELRSYGFYAPKYNLASSSLYAAKLDVLRGRQKAMLKAKRAASCSIAWTVNGSVVEGRKQTNQTMRLMLRAFNGECDAAIAKVKHNNVVVMQTRITKAAEAIDALAAVQQCAIARDYVNLKLDELSLAYEYERKLQLEREEQRELREQMREEEIARREAEKARQEAEREESRFAEALARARDEVDRATGAKQQKLLDQIAKLETALTEAQKNKERAIAQAQLTRRGHVYVISNIGSFGEDVYKVGMTRRLVPHERVDELSNASVPFPFDIHAMITSDDAPALETALHHALHQRRVNLVNEHKEFFRVSLDEIAALVHRLHGEIEVTRAAEATHYRQTQAMIAAGAIPPPRARRSYDESEEPPLVEANVVEEQAEAVEA